jgi:hypothetical protein
VRVADMNLSQALAELAKAKEALERARRAQAEAKPWTDEYRTAVRMVGAAWHRQWRAHERVERLRLEER